MKTEGPAVMWYVKRNPGFILLEGVVLYTHTKEAKSRDLLLITGEHVQVSQKGKIKREKEKNHKLKPITM